MLLPSYERTLYLLSSVDACDCCSPAKITDLRLSVAGAIFRGAPFQGSDAAVLGKWLARLSSCDPTLLQLLEKDSPSLYALSGDFWGIHSDWDLVYFFETMDADYEPLKKQIRLCVSL